MHQKILRIMSLILNGIICLSALYVWFPDILSSEDSHHIPGRTDTRIINSSNEKLDFSELINRPIFQKSRRAKFVAVANTEQLNSLIPEFPLVKGLAITEPNDKFVFIQSSKDGIVYQLREGQLLDGLWRVLEINFTEILLLSESGDAISLDVDT